MDQFRLKISPQNEKTDQRSGRRRIEKMVDHFRNFQNSSLHLKMTNFSNPSRWAISLSRKILCEIHKKMHNLKMRGAASSPDDFEHRFGLIWDTKARYKCLIIQQPSDMSRKTDFLAVLKNTPTILSCDGVFHLFQRKNKKRNFDGTERSVQNSVYTTDLNSRPFDHQSNVLKLKNGDFLVKCGRNVAF